MSQQINLFNPIFLKQEKHFSALTMAQVLGVILAVALLLTAYASYQLSALQNEQKSVTTQLQLAQNQLAKVTADYAPREKDMRLEARLRRAEAQVKSLQQVSDVLRKGELGNTDGYADYLRAFAHQIIDGVWLTGFTIQGAGSTISLQGGALRPELVPAYLTRLKAEPVMQGASFATLEMQLPKSDKPLAPGEKPAAPAAYINFNLHSSSVKPQKGLADESDTFGQPAFNLQEQIRKAAGEGK
ncbi:PilN domain-containing protein [Herminiimonas fonticola]|uniref:Fimbrial assembly protein PilN n=1 Tax=Herminiimonas fonticola TaxID=303380 RepID=A0A4R6GK59_9BURK|nr:PilN domain-containing protein [Herminiimonas fonticola]RBA25742.1 Fimbrial assembly protein (PilN) [Herminiimonas fonticola]TDN94850.1 fimbrial assembly protein PilN [Herminiimonas fonticola]